MVIGPHFAFILAAYAATVLIVGGLILRAVVDHRAQVRALAELEARGARRRSDAIGSAAAGERPPPGSAAGRAARRA